MNGYFYVLVTVALTVYGQLVIKWQVGGLGGFPTDAAGRLQFFGRLLTNPWVASGFALAALAALAYIVALSKLPLSTAYPMMSLSFVIVLGLGSVFFGEPITLEKIGGMTLILGGVWLGSQSS